MKVLECETFDWLEEVMKEKAVRSGKNFSAIQNPYTAERLKDLDATCGIPDDAWINQHILPGFAESASGLQRPVPCLLQSGAFRFQHDAKDFVDSPEWEVGFR